MSRQKYVLRDRLRNFINRTVDLDLSVSPVWVNDIGSSSYLFTLNEKITFGSVYKIIRTNLEDCVTYTLLLSGSNVTIPINYLLLSQLYERVSIINHNNNHFRELLHELKLSEKELLERIEEFEVVKNGKIDLISLDSLFDFYKVPIKQNQFLVSLSE